MTRSVSALLTGSSRERLNGFIGVPWSPDWTGPVLVPVDCSGFDICLVALRLIRDLLLCAKHLCDVLVSFPSRKFKR